MAEDEKQYELNQKVVYGMYNEDDKLLYVGVASANIDNIFVGLYKSSVRGIVIYPVELIGEIQTCKCVVMHIMADDQNNDEDISTWRC